MESFFQIIAILTAGIALALGLLNLVQILQKGVNKVNTLFSTLCFLIVLFILIPPAGFILVDNATNTTIIIVKRIFSLFFIALLPWFIAFYTGYKKRVIPIAVTISIVICYGLFSNSLITQTNPLFLFPINLFPIAFLLIMGIQLQLISNDRPAHKKILGLRDGRWQTLLKDIQLIIINTDTEGRITYINPFGANLLKYDELEIIGTKWSDHCLKKPDKAAKNAEDEHVEKMANSTQVYRNTIIAKDGKEKVINWSSELVYSDEGVLMGRMYTGSDITEHEEACRQIQELKAELEKETLTPKEHSLPAGMNADNIGKSDPFIYAIQKSRQVAPTNASVLLLGETGVGKESFANLIQETSLRSKMPFIKVNCGALPAELIEDELFGHEKGAFTGAIQPRIGRFEKANGGTIFLDEIGELPLLLQPKLLRVLQNGEFERVGGHQTIKVDVRVIAATNNDLEKEVKENRFREDLFYRLNVFPITIPPLRKRNGDIEMLIQNFIERKSKKHGKHFENISRADMNRLCDYEWPGNIRQLKNVIERAVISSENPTLKLDWFYEDIELIHQSNSTPSLEEIEINYIIKILEECSWKINGDNGAAEKLGLHPNTLRSRMKKLNINVPWKQQAGSN